MHSVQEENKQKSLFKSFFLFEHPRGPSIIDSQQEDLVNKCNDVLAKSISNISKNEKM